VKRGLLVLFACVLPVLAFAAGSDKVPGVTDDKIVVGYTMPMSGGLGFMGSQTAYGVESIFKKYNDQGGIFGRKLALIKYDSGMDVAQALANYRKLILEDKVFCVLFGFGTFVRPAYPLFEEQNVPWLFPFSPPEDMMFPAHKYLFSLFPTTATQMQAMTKYIIGQGKWKKVACLYGDTASGKTGLDKLTNLLKASDVKLVDAEAITNDATSAAVQMAKISQAAPDLVMMIGMVQQPAAVAIREIRKIGLKTDIMLNMPLTGANMLALLEGIDIDGIYGAWWGAPQWPSSPGTETPQMKATRLLLMKNYPDVFNNTNVGGTVEHSLSVEVFIEALKRAGKDLTREGLLKALESMQNYDTGKGSTATFTATRHEGTAGGIIMQVKKRDWAPISSWIDVPLE
jgi:branched-chain amino acid transport system substrate-binding protein